MTTNTSAKWARAEVEIDSRGSRVKVIGGVWPDVPGLAVTPGQEMLSGVWMVTHVPSGKRLGWGFKTKREACDLLLKLAPLGDWTRSQAELRDDKPFFAEAAAICGETVHE